jgi:hypothetical protein
MTAVRVIPAEAAQRSGVLLDGGVITAGAMERELHKGAEENVRPLTPLEQRREAEDRYLGDVEANDANYVRVPLTVKSDREVAEARRTPDEQHREAVERRNAEAQGEAAAKLAADFHAHTRTLERMAAEAKGNPTREARVVEQVRQSAAVGEALKARGVL